MVYRLSQTVDHLGEVNTPYSSASNLNTQNDSNTSDERKPKIPLKSGSAGGSGVGKTGGIGQPQHVVSTQDLVLDTVDSTSLGGGGGGGSRQGQPGQRGQQEGKNRVYRLANFSKDVHHQNDTSNSYSQNTRNQRNRNQYTQSAGFDPFGVPTQSDVQRDENEVPPEIVAMLDNYLEKTPANSGFGFSPSDFSSGGGNNNGGHNAGNAQRHHQLLPSVHGKYKKPVKKDVTTDTPGTEKQSTITEKQSTGEEAKDEKDDSEYVYDIYYSYQLPANTSTASSTSAPFATPQNQNQTQQDNIPGLIGFM